MEPELAAVASTSYEGSADIQGRWSGHGRVTFESGATYEGEWSAGQMHGRGKLTFPDGIAYEGEFQHNQLTGKGVYTWPSGAVYEGTVLRGKREGRGKLSFTKSPAVYDGDWHDGMRHGQGVLYTNAARTSYYRGSWVNDMKQGPGVMKYENGDVYDGIWEADVKRGLGTMRWEAAPQGQAGGAAGGAAAGGGRRQQYSGEWEHNVPHGCGLHVWFGEEAGEPGVPSHAQLLMHNRYYGHFKAGRRHGYGVLYYATGARYEGYWAADQKHGQGVYVFENGEVWAGFFAHDRPLLAPGETFAPASTGIVLQIDDLVEEEENAAACRRAISNLLLCFNTELRMLYDKYCKRPSHHLPAKVPRLSFSLLAAQVWDMAADCRLLSPSLTLGALDDILATARRAPERLRAFRQQEAPASLDYLPHEQRRFWEHLASEHTPGGAHSPVADLTFRSFCEAVVRIAAARFHALPSLERRLHQTLTLHLLHLVNKAKATPPAPPPPSAVLPPNTSVAAAVAAADAARQRLAEAFLRAAGAPPPRSREEAAVAGGAAGGPDPVYGVTAPAHALAAELEAAAAAAAARGGGGGGGGQMRHPLSMKQALMMLLWNYLSRNAYGSVQRMAIDPLDEGGTYRTTRPTPEDNQELLFAMDTPLTFAEFLDGCWRIAADWTDPDAWLADRLAAVLGGAGDESASGEDGGGGGGGSAGGGGGGAGRAGTGSGSVGGGGEDSDGGGGGGEEEAHWEGQSSEEDMPLGV